MTILSQRVWRTLTAAYRRDAGLRPQLIGVHGMNVSCRPSACVCNIDVLRQARRDALEQGVRWGEPYIFFLAPGLMAWMVPIVKGTQLIGGLQGPEVVPASDPDDRERTINYLVAYGARRKDARAYMDARIQIPQSDVPAAAWTLYELLYQISPYTPEILTRHRENALQQRQIAEAIHEQKQKQETTYTVHDERLLLSQLRAGDRTGARGTLNRVLAAMFLYSPKLPLIRARAIELLGFLVRAAIEDNPVHEPMLHRHQEWIERVLDSESFEAMSVSMRTLLDEFMDAIFLHGYNRSSAQVRKILEYLSENYAQPVSLDDVSTAVGLSRFYTARLVKNHTGRTVTQHLLSMRIRRARHLLEHTDMSSSEMAYTLGFTDQSYFIRRFRELTGTTPLKYRKQRR